MTEEYAYGLALRVARTPRYSVIEVRRAWSAMCIWHVEIQEHCTGERLLLLSHDQFDSRLRAMAGEAVTTEEAIETTVVGARPPHPIASLNYS